MGVPPPCLDTYTHALEPVKREKKRWVADCINDLVCIVRTKDCGEVARITTGHLPVRHA